VTITVHGDRVTDPQKRLISKAPDRTTSIRRPDPVTVARAAKALMRTRLRAGDPPAKVERVVRSRLPEAWTLLDHRALVAMARRPPSPGCHWCSVAVVCCASQDPEPPRDELHLALLGQPCARCAQRHVTDLARVEVPTKQKQPCPPGMVRNKHGLCGPSPTKRKAAATSVSQRDGSTGRVAQPPVAATGMIWAASDGEPPGITAALAARARHARQAGSY
jgi:hypothetical protein